MVNKKDAGKLPSLIAQRGKLIQKRSKLKKTSKTYQANYTNLTNQITDLTRQISALDEKQN